MRLQSLLRNPFVVAAIAFTLLGLLSLMPGEDSTGPGLPLLRLGLALLGILAIAVAVVPALKRLPSGARRNGGRIRCEEQLALDAKHRLALVSVDGHTILLGMNPDGITLLKDLGEPCSEPTAADFNVEFPSSEKLKDLLSKRPEL